MHTDHDEAMTEARFRAWREHEGDDYRSAAWVPPVVDVPGWIVGIALCVVAWWLAS